LLMYIKMAASLYIPMEVHLVIHTYTNIKMLKPYKSVFHRIQTIATGILGDRRVIKRAFLLFISFIFFFSCTQDSRVSDDVQLYPIQVNDLDGYINKHGELIIKPEFLFADDFSEGYGVVHTKKNEYGFISIDGKVIVVKGVRSLHNFHSGLALYVDKENRCGYIDKKMQTRIKPQFNIAYDFSEDFAVVEVLESPEGDDRTAFINTKGHIVFNKYFKAAQGFNEGLSSVEKAGKFGYIFSNGKIVIPCIYDRADRFSETYAPVGKMVEGSILFGFINKEGKEVIEFIYADARPFSEGYAAVCIGEKWGLINKEGVIVLPPKYDELDSPHESIMGFRDDEDWGFVTIDGQIIHEPTFTSVRDFDSGIAQVYKEHVVDGAVYTAMGYCLRNGAVIWGDDLAKQR
jgi:hypothetical protein